MHSVFETTIRYLAALLSAYQLSNNQFPGLLEKAQQLGEKLAFAWTISVRLSSLIWSSLINANSQEQAIPFNNLDFNSNTAQVANVSIALSHRCGTLKHYRRTLLKLDRQATSCFISFIWSLMSCSLRWNFSSFPNSPAIVRIKLSQKTQSGRS